MFCGFAVLKARAVLFLPVVTVVLLSMSAVTDCSRAGPAGQSGLSDRARARLVERLPAMMTDALKLAKQNKYEQAAELASKVVEGLESLGWTEASFYVSNMRFAAQCYGLNRDFERAEAIHLKVLALRKERLGPKHVDVAESLADLSDIHVEQQKYDLAEQELKQTLAIREAGLRPSDPAVGFTYVKLGGLANRRLHFDEAEQHWRKALAMFEAHLPPDHLYIPLVLNNLAEIHKHRADYDGAEILLKRALTINESKYKDTPLLAAANLNNLADLSRLRGDYEQAESLQRRELGMTEKALGLDHPSTARSLNNLALILDGEGRSAAAIPLFRRARAIAEKTKPVDPQVLALYVNNLALALSWSEDGQPEAEQLFLKSLKLREQALGPDHLLVANSSTNLATLYLEREDYKKALAYARRAVNIHRHALPADHPELALSISNLAIVLDNLAQPSEAQRLHQEALAIRKKALGPLHPQLAINYNNLGGTAVDQNRYEDAFGYFELANAIWLRRINQRAAKKTGPDRELMRYTDSFLGLARSAYELAQDAEPVRYEQFRDKAFEAMQWAQGTRSAAALARFAARVAAGTGPMADLVRKRQDLANRIEALDNARLKAVTGAPGSTEADRDRIDARLKEAQAELMQLDGVLAREFPDFTKLTRPHPLTLNEAQKNIGTDEALYAIASTRGGSFVFVVTDRLVVWKKIAVTRKELEHEVAVLRCGLDSGQWYGEGYEKCRKRVGKAPKGAFLPYDLKRAHRLYELLLAPFADVIKGKELLFVSSGALSGLPIQALVTQPPALNDNTPRAYREASWFASKAAVTILPAVSSLVDLRQSDKQVSHSDGFLAIANPLLDGSPRAKAWEVERAKLARQITGCDKAALASATTGRNISIAPLRSLASGLADPALLRAQMALPETADEVCRVGTLLHRNKTLIMLGKDAMETRINKLNNNNDLRSYGIVHFATHGALAGEVARDMEPGLILTPPQKASHEDDGYLTVSEIADLKLNADWVILSACNTAAGDAESQEVLSGLARAFFYAGARSLLVSHWAVDSQATVELITGALKETSADKQLSKSEALRRSMVKLMQSQPEHLAHPSYWAPFILAGAK